jgi:hypothetical protein
MATVLQVKDKVKWRIEHQMTPHVFLVVTCYISFRWLLLVYTSPPSGSQWTVPFVTTLIRIIPATIWNRMTSQWLETFSRHTTSFYLQQRLWEIIFTFCPKRSAANLVLCEYWVSFQRVMQPQSEAGTREKQNTKNFITSRPPICLHGVKFRHRDSYMRAVCEVRGLNLLLWVGTLWRCGDGLFFEVPPLASDALLTTLNPLLETCCRPLITSTSLACPEISWGEIWIEFCVRLGKNGSVEPH